jgi:hypothetical protein
MMTNLRPGGPIFGPLTQAMDGIRRVSHAPRPERSDLCERGSRPADTSPVENRTPEYRNRQPTVGKAWMSSETLRTPAWMRGASHWRATGPELIMLGRVTDAPDGSPLPLDLPCGVGISEHLDVFPSETVAGRARAVEPCVCLFWAVRAHQQDAEVALRIMISGSCGLAQKWLGFVPTSLFHQQYRQVDLRKHVLAGSSSSKPVLGLFKLALTLEEGAQPVFGVVLP